jgi:hypothetical protein
VLAATLAAAMAPPPAAATVAGTDPANPYREVRILWEDVAPNRQLIQELQLEIMNREPDTWIHALCRNAELAALDQAGVPYTIIHDDLESFYAERMAADYGDQADNFGAFHTYSETVDFMDQLHADYPDITTDKIAIGATWEGNTIWAMKISDNPTIEEPDEPEVLFDGMHHAREIMTVEVLIDYMTWLCEGYGVDDEATQLVDTRQIWFIPLVNVDGFLYNEQTNPQGGGMWRKNRRDDQGACIGVDPNRNYPYEWGGVGSSGDPCSETYRGPSAGSEWVNQSYMMFVNNHEFVTHDTYHTVVGIILFPWGYTSSPTPDDALFRSIAAERTRESGYPYGQPHEILYPVSGNTFDWTYGDTTSKPKIFSYSTEVGGSGFWPAESEIPGLLAQCHYSNIVLTRVAGVYLTLTTYDVVGGNGNGRLDPGETADLVVTVQNIGAIADANGVELTLASSDAYLTLGDAEGAVGTIAAGASADNAGDPFTLTALASTPEGHLADLVVTMTEASGFTATGQVTLRIGEAPIVYCQDFEASSDWEQDPTHTATTGAFVRIDPNPTEYQPGDDTTPPPGIYGWITGQNSAVGTDDVDGGISATRSPVFDASGLASARLDLNWFHGQRDPGDDSQDFFRIELSNDGGASYPVRLVDIGDVTHAATWNGLVVDLEDHLPLTSQMRVRIQASDGPATGDIVEGGVDDFCVFDNGTGNAAPGAPELVSPPNGAGNQPAAPTLVVANAVDPEGDPLTYTFRIYADPLLTTPVREVTGVAEGAGTTAWTVTPDLPNGTWYWRAHAADPELYGPYMAAASFEVTGGTTAVDDAAGAAPGRPVLAAATPNPFSAGTHLSYTLPSRARVRIDIFDVSGRHVRALVEGVAEAGHHVRAWDGLETGGRRAAAGVYLVQMQVDGVKQTQKLIRLP